MVDFVDICNVYVGKMIIKASKRIFNSDKICRSYSDLNFGVTFFGTQCSMFLVNFCNFLISEMNAPPNPPLQMEFTPVYRYALLRRSRSMARHTSK